jgi:hypothetical protein
MTPRELAVVSVIKSRLLHLQHFQFPSISYVWDLYVGWHAGAFPSHSILQKHDTALQIV